MNILEDLKNVVNNNYRIIVIILLTFILFNMCVCNKKIVALLGGGGGHKHNDEKYYGGAGCGDKTYNGGNKPLTIKLYWVSWCGHCNKFKPTWDKMKKNNKLDVTFEDINCEEQKEIAQQEGIQGFPTIRLYDSDNNLLEELEGSRDEDSIKNLIKNHN